ncbi:MAG: hypothetical protein KF754_12785 [Planctomycetes bacterium]|nr:hypothetical protein [Planctomycetota bacterium]
MKTLALACCLLLAGCTTTSWVEETNVTRATGQPTVRQVDRPLAHQTLQLTTTLEEDGFVIDRRIHTGDEGVARINLLPVALQRMVYGRDVKLTLWSYDDNRFVHEDLVSEARAAEIVAQWRIQCRLGTRTPLRSSEAALLDRAIGAAPDPETAQALREIKLKVDLRPDWE